MSDDVVFSDPPPRGGRYVTRYSYIFDACRANPGRWAEFPGSRQGPSKLNRGFQFTERGQGKDNRKIWVRFVGEDGEFS